MRRSTLPLLFVCLASCTQMTTSSTRYATAPAISAVSADSVQVVTGDLKKAFTQLGEVSVRWNGTRLEYGLLEDPAVRAALRKEAAKLGADAIIDLRLVTIPGGRRSDRMNAEPPLVKGVAATAIRFVDPGAGPTAFRTR